MAQMYYSADWQRLAEEPASNLATEEYRKPWRRDSARVLHCAAFRRLQGKTQLFPGLEHDFFRNRLTHSLEVGQIAKSIAIRLNETEEFLRRPKMKIKPDLCELAGWCHDLGHPPFGHNGEEALDERMKLKGGFEGNGQTLRILTRLEKRGNFVHPPDGIGPEQRDSRYGLNLTSRAMAAILKYDQAIDLRRENRSRPQKGYYREERDRVQEIKDNVTRESNYAGEFKTVECQIMDIADDIAYSTYDLEDAFKAGFMSPFDMVTAPEPIVEQVAEKVTDRCGESFTPAGVRDVLYQVFRDIFDEDRIADGDSPITPNQVYASAMEAYDTARNLVEDGRLRTKFTSWLVGHFIRNVVLEPNEQIPALSCVSLTQETKAQVEVLKNFTYFTLIESPHLKLIRYRGVEMTKEMFDALTGNEADLLPNDVRRLYTGLDQEHCERVVCDFLAGMTDRYAVEFYGRLFSAHPQTLFKPV